MATDVLVLLVTRAWEMPATRALILLAAVLFIAAAWGAIGFKRLAFVAAVGTLAAFLTGCGSVGSVSGSVSACDGDQCVTGTLTVKLKDRPVGKPAK
jgi:hypothetical protein